MTPYEMMLAGEWSRALVEMERLCDPPPQDGDVWSPPLMPGGTLCRDFEEVWARAPWGAEELSRACEVWRILHRHPHLKTLKEPM